MNEKILLTLVASLLDWPFLAFSLMSVFGFAFRHELAERISSVRELTLGGKTKILLGTHEVEADQIGTVLTDAFRDLESRVEKIEATAGGETRILKMPEDASVQLDDLPEGLREMLWTSVYRMLNSEYWYARYVDTLASNTSTSEELMLSFLKSRPEIDVFKDGDRWAASLKSRSR